MFIWKLTSRKKYSIAIVHGPDHKIQLQTSQSPSSWASVVATSVQKPRKDQRIETSPHASTSPTQPTKILLLQLQKQTGPTAKHSWKNEKKHKLKSQLAPTESPQRDTPTPPPRFRYSDRSTWVALVPTQPNFIDISLHIKFSYAVATFWFCRLQLSMLGTTNNEVTSVLMLILSAITASQLKSKIQYRNFAEETSIATCCMANVPCRTVYHFQTTSRPFSAFGDTAFYPQKQTISHHTSNVHRL
jgi:hypothetical protein